MNLDRDDLAARVLVALAPLREGTPAALAREAFTLAAAFDREAHDNASLPSLADAEWRDAPRAAPSPAASPAAYVPKCGDRVLYPDGRAYVVTAYTPGTDFPTAVYDIGGKTTTFFMDGYLTYDRPATAAERVAAGLDAPAVDREGLARELCGAWWGRPMGEWDATPCDRKADWLRAADAAIAFLKANGGA